jgi:hypothetical protein
MKSQQRMFYEAQRELAALDRNFFERVNDSINPITNSDLEKLVVRYPERWARYSGFIGKLPH